MIGLFPIIIHSLTNIDIDIDKIRKKFHKNRTKKIFLTITDLFLDTKKKIETINITQHQTRP